MLLWVLYLASDLPGLEGIRYSKTKQKQNTKQTYINYEVSI
jgi:hypothetical protein